MRAELIGSGLLALIAVPARGADPTPPPGPHAAHAAEPPMFRDGGFPRPVPLPAVTPGPDAIVYGYQAYWSNDLETVPWDQLSHLAVFSAGATSTGALTDTSRWALTDEAVAMAAPYGVKVHLCVTNFDPASLGTLLGSATHRQTLIDNLVDWVDQTGAHGVNVDFEGLPLAQKQNMVTFTKDLDAVVDEVVLATPAVDWSGAWDYSELTKYADLFIMGYGYHWSGSSYAGPNDPLYGGSPWAQHSLSWTLDDYRANDADPARVILGLPLYGIRWPVGSNTVPAAATGSGSSVVFSTAWAEAATHGRQYDAVSHTPYWYDGTRQGWYGDVDTLRERIAYTIDEGFGGIGFWALHYDGDDPDLWAMVAEETTAADTGDTGTDTGDTGTDTGDTGDTDTDVPGDLYFADAGNPFLAYVGDTVILSGAASEGPEPLVYQWTQVSGPSVALSDDTAMEPSFKVRETGTHAFDLVVGDGTTWSAPARSYVVVLDPNAGARYKGCSCATPPGAALGALPLLVLIPLLRRRR